MFYAEIIKRLLSRLQWVHGLVTVVMVGQGTPTPPKAMLQWVHGLVTVVIRPWTH
jgi:hypothetical protein